VVDGGRSLPLGGARQRGVLALLLTRPNRVVSTDRLVDELWGAQPPKAALNTIQYCVSQLRKLLGADRIVTRPPGYLILVNPGELDLDRFELLLEQDHAGALREALALWRGPALADLAFEPFALAETARLEELRFAALERRLDLDLEDGRGAELVGELEGLIAEHPLRERLRGQLMVALYRGGRQGEALAAYQAARATLVERLGIEPGPALRGLERAILRQEPSLLVTRADQAASPGRQGPVIVAPSGADALDSLLAIAEPLAGSAPPRELILVRLVPSHDLGLASRLLHERSASLSERGVAARSAVFTSHEPGAELTRLASEQHADLVLLDAPTNFLSDGVFGGVAGAVLASASCDVGIVVCRDGRAPEPELSILVPFAGAEHDWAAVELAAWIARAAGTTLYLLGREADLAAGDRDASRLLAQASLLVQRVVRVPTEPILVAAGSAGILRAADRARLLVFGLSDRWRQDGLGQTRLTIAREAACPTLLVRKGLKPGGIAPDQTLTRFTWSLANARP
jgi:DNA-binding SARP family transcriptional activator/nucleotide-binding universal stress UspA family protein